MNLGWIPSAVLYLVGIFILAVTFKNRLGKKKTSTAKQSWDNILEKEHAAQFVRTKPLPEHFFIHVDFNKFPVVDDDDCKKVYLSLERFATSPMINLRGQSNLDIKSIYGPQALEQVSAYERNYFEFMDISIKYGKILNEKGYLDEAVITLEQCIQYQCDISKCYLLLIEIYQKQNNNNALIKLKDIVMQEMQNSPFLNKVLEKF